MNNNLVELIKNKNLIVGKIKYIEDFALFERISLEDALKMNEKDLAFATPSMGRGIFKFGENGQIINIKGVDSHLDNSENALKAIIQAKAQYVITDGSMNYTDSTHPINLIIYPGNKADIRIRGTSPLEDLEIEADVNSKLKEMGVKVPIIKQIREYPIRVLEQLRLPSKIKTKSTDERIKASYSDEDKARKEYLHNIFGNRYIEEETIGFRPEFIGEYFERIHLTENPTFIEFATQNGLTINQFIDAVDKQYELGQRYGQTIRVVESPYRIADIQHYLSLNDVKSLERIAEFTNASSKQDLPYEIYFAKQMGKNVATLMNFGWISENMMHRQDYSLLGEMCDDSYYDLGLTLKKIENQIEEKQNNPNKNTPLEINILEATKADKIDYFYLQFMHFSSCIKVLQDEMRLRKMPEALISNCMNEYIKAFTQAIDFDQVAKSLNIAPEKAKEDFARMLSSKDFARDMAKQRRENGYEIDEQTFIAHQDFNDFYINLANIISKRVNISLINEFNIVQHIINMDESQIDSFIESRLRSLEENATEHRSELSLFDIGCSRINGRGDTSEVIGYIPRSTNIKHTQNDPIGFSIDDIELYKMLVSYIRETNPEYIVNNGTLSHKSIMRLVQATLINYFGLGPSEEKRNYLYAKKATESQTLSIIDFKRSETAMSAERSAVAQNLLAFLGYNPMLIYGYSSKKDKDINSCHCFNIVTTNNTPYLIDFSNPKIEGKVFKKTCMYQLTDTQFEGFRKGQGIYEVSGEKKVYSSEEIDPLYFDRIDFQDVDY